MPRLSLYKPEKGNDYKFIDRQISEMFQVGGTDVYLHKYMGPKLNPNGTQDQPTIDSYNVTNIQDLLFLENRDRKYDSEIYRIRGLYNVQNIDFNLSQFGLFIDNDTLYMTVHINDFISYIGRKPMSGDVIELPHLRDEFAFSDADVSLPRYYVIEDVGRASEGFSATWYPHLYRLKLKKVTNNQQYADIFNVPVSAEDKDKFVGDFAAGTKYYTGQIVRLDGQLYQVKAGFDAPIGTTLQPPNTTAWTNYVGNTLETILSTRAKELAINDKILEQAEADAPKSGYETRQFYTLAVDDSGKTVLTTSDTTVLDASQTGVNNNVSSNNSVPLRTGYTGYLVSDGAPVNGYMFGHGIQFPEAPAIDDFFLRTDFMPSRLFRFTGQRWAKVEDDVRMTMTNNDQRQTLKTGFINNTGFTYVDEVSSDYVTLVTGATIINTTMDYVAAPYVTLKIETFVLDYALADHPTLIMDNAGKAQIHLPSIDGTQIEIPYDGVWKVGLFNHREQQKQSLSKALRYRPEADV